MTGWDKLNLNVLYYLTMMIKTLINECLHSGWDSSLPYVGQITGGIIWARCFSQQEWFSIDYISDMISHGWYICACNVEGPSVGKLSP